MPEGTTEDAQVVSKAQEAGVTARHIWRLEANQRPNIAAVTLARVVRALEVNMEYLVGLSDSPQPSGGEAGR